MTLQPKNDERKNLLKALPDFWAEDIPQEDMILIITGEESDAREAILKYELLTEADLEAYDKGELVF